MANQVQVIKEKKVSSVKVCILNLAVTFFSLLMSLNGGETKQHIRNTIDEGLVAYPSGDKSEIVSEPHDAKSCFPPLKGAGPQHALSQLRSTASAFFCARALMFAEEQEEEGGASRGTEGCEGGLKLFRRSIL